MWGFSNRRVAALLVVSALAVGAGGALALQAVLDSGGGKRKVDRAALATPAERFKPDKTTPADCDDSNLVCMEQAYANMASREGAKTVLASLASHTGSGDILDRNCHRLTHAVGYGVLYRLDGDVGKAFTEGDSTCWSGYFHGVLERGFAGVKDKDMAKVATGLCTSDEVRATTFLHYQCVHGLGHGLMLHTGYELPASLKVCEAFKDNWESTSCDGGVFMENISTSRGTTSKYLRDNDLVYPCNTIDERHKLYCYLMLTSRVLQANGYNWAATEKVCRTQVETDWRDECFQSLGRDASGQARQVIKQVAQTCTVARGKWHQECVYGAARDMVSEDAGPDRAARFCGLVAASARSRCASGVGTIVGDLQPDTASRNAACDKAFRAASLPKFAATCRAGSFRA